MSDDPMPIAPALPAAMRAPDDDRLEAARLLRELFAGPAYEPPYATPVEDALAWNLVKYLHPEVRLRKEVRIQTLHGALHLAFVLERGPRRIGLACAETPPEETLSAWQDSLLLGTGAADAVYRLHGAVLDRPADALQLLARWEPGFFSERGTINLRRLASEEARLRTTLTPRRLRIVYRAAEAGEDGADAGEIVLARTRVSEPDAWKSRYDFARRTGGSLEQIMDAYDRRGAALAG